MNKLAEALSKHLMAFCRRLKKMKKIQTNKQTKPKQKKKKRKQSNKIKTQTNKQKPHTDKGFCNVTNLRITLIFGQQQRYYSLAYSGMTVLPIAV